MERGKYIIIDGIEAIGKESLKRRITGLLQTKGIEVQNVREPGGTQFAEIVRALIKEPVLTYEALRERFYLVPIRNGDSPIPGYDFSQPPNDDELLTRDSWTEVLAFLLSRSSAADRVILPAIKDGKWVVADRAWTTTFAYQGFGRFDGEEEDLELIARNHKRILEKVFPGDRVYIIDITVEESFRRMKADSVGRTTTDYMDRQQADFFERARAGYQSLKRRYPKQVRIINGMRRPEEIFTDIKADLERLL